ncbi:MAG TPA: thiamine pyrophosphate-dependent dehydrogenase E1 component subunit alpha [Solirubrobacteraceae bacterium]|nr:thiamine pyrophosphate-dependent dehydrogenase E1 component subunit alpha [Solirubrobacteraceae bacterium]
MARRGTSQARARAKGKARARSFDAETARDLLATMWRIRRFEERMATLHQRLLVHGLIHLSIGSEGVAAAVCRQLRDDDEIYSGHRAHGHVLAKGAPMDRVMAELMGRSDGLCRGLGGSMHLVDVAHGVMGATGVVGGNLPMAAGGALAAKVAGSDRVTVVFFGDGAVQAGHFAETVNLASLWELPLILVCENNGMAEFTTRAEHTRVESVCDVVAPYGFERRLIEGADVEAIWRAFGGYLHSARTGTGPFLLECRTHRRRGHYEGDPLASRNALGDAEWAKLDPIAQLEAVAAQRGWIDEGRAQALTAEADAEVQRAIEFGRSSDPLSSAEAAELVYA